MSVWLAIPSKRRPEEVEKVLSEWRRMGYKIALVVDDERDAKAKDHMADVIISSPDGYRGYARSMNELLGLIIQQTPHAEWFVCAGDDTLPDPKHDAETIAFYCQVELGERFNEGQSKWESSGEYFGTFGVMQPTGDPWRDAQGRIIERIAGSPWIGREFARRMYGGAGPYWHEYTHCFVDEELQCVAQKLGVFWQRSDVCQMHYNWARRVPGSREEPVMPAFLADANSPQHWAKFSKLFVERKKAGFPGHEPIA